MSNFPAIWPADKPFKVAFNIATGERLTRTTETGDLYATEVEARAAYAVPRHRNECSRVLIVMHFGQPDNYGHKDTAECLARRKFRRA